jgi:hypothetical protein
MHLALAVREGEDLSDGAEHDSVLAACSGFNFDPVHSWRGKHESQAGLRGRSKGPETDGALAASSPQYGPRDEGVLILPVVPVRMGLHGVDGLGDEAVAHGREGHDTAPAVGTRRDDGEPPGLDRHVAPGLVSIEAAAPRAGGQEVQVEALHERVGPRPPLSRDDRVPVRLGIPAVAHPVVRHSDEGRDLPDPLVALGLVADERVPLHVAHEGVEEDEPRSLKDAPEDRVARPPRVARPAVEAGEDHHLEGLRSRELLLDVAVHRPQVVSVPAELVPVEVADPPAVDVPAAVDGDRGRLEGEPLHELDHVPALGDGGDEEAADGPAGKLRRPRDVRRHDLGRVDDVVPGFRCPLPAEPGAGESERRQGKGGQGRRPPGASGGLRHRDASFTRVRSVAESRSR